MTMSAADHRTHPPRFASAPVPPDPDAPGHGWPGRWPRRSSLELAALDTAPGCARRHASALMREWGLDALTDETALIVSELTTNAMLSTRARAPISPVRLWVLGSRSAALFLVWDATTAAPAPVDAAPGDEHGRGLALVDALSTRWGWYHPNQAPGGKVVWALLQAPGGGA